MNFTFDLPYGIQARIVTFLLKKMRKQHNRAYRNFCLPGDHIGDNIFLHGLYEHDVLLGLFNKVFADKSLRFKETICIDVGANIGNHTIFFSDIFNKVYAFEPNPVFCAVAKASLALAGIHNVEVIEVGLSDAPANLAYEFRRDQLGESSFKTFDSRDAEMTLRVERGDDIVSSLMLSEISFLKIDVEGHELKVLAGLSKTLEMYSPLILFESQASMNMPECQKVLKFLQDSKYKYIYAYEYERRSKSTAFNIVQRIVSGPNKRSLKQIQRLESQPYLALIASKTALKL